MPKVFLSILGKEGVALAGLQLVGEDGKRLPDVNGQKALANFRHGDREKELEACTKLQAYADANGITVIE